MQIKISKISKDGEATVEILNPNKNGDEKEIIQRVTNFTMVANVICEDNYRYMVPFNITSKNLISSSLNLKLAYPNPSNISMGGIADKLEILVVQKIQLRKGARIILLKNRTFTSDNIPPQLVGQVAQKIAKWLEGGRLTFTRFTPLNVAIGIGVQFIWV